MLMEYAESRTGNSQNGTVRFARLLTCILADLRSGKSTPDLATQALRGAEWTYVRKSKSRVRKELLAMARQEVDDAALRGCQTRQGG